MTRFTVKGFAYNARGQIRSQSGAKPGQKSSSGAAYKTWSEWVGDRDQTEESRAHPADEPGRMVDPPSIGDDQAGARGKREGMMSLPQAMLEKLLGHAKSVKSTVESSVFPQHAMPSI